MDKSLLNKAIAATEEPTPGWMFHTIAKWTRDFSTCQKLEDYLLKKLNDNSPHTKRKVLIIIKNIAQQGDTQFALNFARKSEEIKKYTSYKGPLDPMHGDNLNLQIRTAASQAIEAVFKRTESKSSQGIGFGEGNTGMQGIHNPHIGTMGKDPSAKDYSGFGSNTFTPSTPTPFTTSNVGSMPMGGGKYKGIGNPNFAQPEINVGAGQANPEGWLSWTKDKVTGVFTGSKKGYEGTFDPSTQFQANWLNNGDEKGSYTAPAAMGMGMPARPIYQEQSTHQGSNDWDIPKNSDNSGTHEAKIIDEFCASSGVKVAPTRQELSQFCTRCASVNGDILAEKLDDKLSNPAWQVKLKALHAIEALIKAKNGAVVDYFLHNFENVQAQTVAVQETVAQRAQKVLALLNKSEGPVPETSKKPQGTKKPIAKPTMKQQQEDLLPFDLDDNPIGNNGKVEGTKTLPATPSVDEMFNGMSFHETPSTTPANVGSNSELDDIFASQPTNTKKRPNTSPQRIINMFNQGPTVAPVQVPVRTVPMPVMAPVMPQGFVQPMQFIQPVYIPVAPMTAVPNPRLAPVGVKPLNQQQDSGFDFMNSSNTANQEQKVDSFDFVKTEILGKK